MRILENSEIDLTREYFEEARKEALKSSCYLSKCGAVLIKKGIIRGRGFNSPPGNKKLERCFKDSIPENFKSDRTCCVHAEERAIIDGIYTFIREEIKGSTLYFTRLNKENQIIPVGKPYCTICSKLALDNDISKWVLFHEFGFTEYDADEYNDLSFGLKPWDPKNL
jgi:deoxycytidylate deaminase